MSDIQPVALTPGTSLSNSDIVLVQSNSSGVVEAMPASFFPVANTPQTRMSNPYKFSGYMSTAGFPSGYSTAVNTWTRTPISTKTFDTSSNLDITTNPGRFTAPAAGYYRFDGHIQTNIYGTSGRFIVALYKNGAEYAFGSDLTAAVNTYLGASVGEFVPLSVGDYVEFMYFSSLSQSLDLTTNRTRFSGCFISAS